jgi:GAF domain-containing protein
MSPNALAQILSEIALFAETASDLTALQDFIVETIPKHLPYYNWTGFYMLDPSDAQTLVLGSFRGAQTEHVHILVNEGICGAAVAQDSTVIVDDVNSDPRYLACSLPWMELPCMKGLDVNGLMWTSAMTKDLGAAGVWASDEAERSAKRARAVRMGDLRVIQIEC